MEQVVEENQSLKKSVEKAFEYAFKPFDNLLMNGTEIILDGPLSAKEGLSLVPFRLPGGLCNVICKYCQ